MRANEDGSVVLTAQEAREVANVLRLGRELAEQLDSRSTTPDTIEARLDATIDLLEDLGVSPEELTEKVDSRRRPG